MTSLSLIVPVFNPGDSIQRLLRSLASLEAEIVFVDDGSTDGTLERLRLFCEARGGCSITSQANLGPGVARQLGVGLAQGEYVAFADSDDEVIGEVFGRAVAFADEHSLDVVVMDFEEVVDGQAHVRTGLSHEAGQALVDPEWVLKSRAAVWGKIYRCSFLDAHKVTFPVERGAEDVVFSWLLASAKPQTGAIAEVSYRYWRQPSEQLTSTISYYLQGSRSLARLLQVSRGHDSESRRLAYSAVTRGWAHAAKRVSLLAARRMRARCGTIWRGSDG